MNREDDIAEVRAAGFEAAAADLEAMSSEERRCALTEFRDALSSFNAALGDPARVERGERVLAAARKNGRHRGSADEMQRRVAARRGQRPVTTELVEDIEVTVEAKGTRGRRAGSSQFEAEDLRLLRQFESESGPGAPPLRLSDFYPLAEKAPGPGTLKKKAERLKAKFIKHFRT